MFDLLSRMPTRKPNPGPTAWVFSLVAQPSSLERGMPMKKRRDGVAGLVS